jgi:hypothetical protein
VENIDLIRKIAWSFHKSTGLDWDDLFQEGYLAYEEAMKSYDPDKGKISTHCWKAITSRLNCYIFDEKKWRQPLVDIDKIRTDKLPALTTSPFWELLTDEAMQIAKVIIRTPNKYVYATSDYACERVYSVMKARGWSHNKINKGLYDLIVVCNVHK